MYYPKVHGAVRDYIAFSHSFLGDAKRAWYLTLTYNRPNKRAAQGRRGMEGKAMQYTTTYTSPLGELLLAGEGDALTGLWFQGQKHFCRTLNKDHAPGEPPVFEKTRRWLDDYFSGRGPGPTPSLRPEGTPFQKEVWALLTAIPCGAATTYGDLARRLSEAGRKTSPRAVGGAVARNPISILIPCHRVLGADGTLTGYAAGTDKKAALLTLEGAISIAATKTVRRLPEQRSGKAGALPQA